MNKKTLNITLELTSENTFDIHIYEPESGESKNIRCKDSNSAYSQILSCMTLYNEIRSWVSLMREESEE